MSTLVPLRSIQDRLPIEFKPEETKRRVAQADAVIDYAKKVKDWPTLTRAIDEKVEEQRDFIGWWDAAVGVRKDAGSKSNADRRGTLSRESAEKQTEIKQQTVSKWRKHLKDEASELDYKALLYGAEYRLAMGEQKPHGTDWSGEVEHYTPAQYIEAARMVLGAIDLDPASNDIAQETVRAAEYFTADNSGLTKEWHGRVWMNPPYHRDLMPAFVKKMVEEVTAKRVTAAVMLTNASTDTEWFQNAAAACTAICFTKGRISFLKPDGTEQGSPPTGQAFFYFGQDIDSFASVFSSYGFGVRHDWSAT